MKENMKRMIEAGYSREDAEEICKLETLFNEECERIAEECELEGFPAYGSNYDLRCESAREYFDNQIALIDSKYDDSEGEEE